MSNAVERIIPAGWQGLQEVLQFCIGWCGRSESPRPGVLSPLRSAPQTPRHPPPSAGPGHPRPPEGRPAAGALPKPAADGRLTASSHASGNPALHARPNPLPLAPSTRLHRKPPRLEPGARERPPTPLAARPKPCGRPRPSTATLTLPSAAPTGARAAAASGAGAVAPALSGSGRRHGRSSVPEPAGRERGRPGPGGSEAPAAAATFPARKP